MQEKSQATHSILWLNKMKAGRRAQSNAVEKWYLDSYAQSAMFEALVGLDAHMEEMGYTATD
jgi:23S rRNA maturation mini-RNase III